MSITLLKVTGTVKIIYFFSVATAPIALFGAAAIVFTRPPLVTTPAAEERSTQPTDDPRVKVQDARNAPERAKYLEYLQQERARKRAAEKPKTGQQVKSPSCK